MSSLREHGAALREAVASGLATDVKAVDRAVLRAEEVFEGRFPCLGYGVGQIPSGRGWHQDQFHDFEWDRHAYFARCDFVKRKERCDVKVPWEFSRLHGLLWLAEAALLAPDLADRYAARVAEIISDWIDNNPVGFGVNWTSAMEVSIRGTNLALVLATLWERLDPQLAHRTARLVYEHLRYLERFPEISDVPGNHFLASLMGMAILKRFLGKGGFQASVEAFFDEAGRQFAEDGCHIERAPRYHLLCLEMVLLVTALAGPTQRRRGMNILDDGLEFCSAISSETGLIPIFGDSDDGRVIWFGGQRNSWQHLASARGALATEASPEAVKLDSFSAWVQGLGLTWLEQGPMAPFARGPRSEESSAQNLAGFLVLREGPIVVVMRTGSLGLEGRAPHDHDDGLSVWVFVGPTELIAEGGCHSYTLDPRIRIRDLGSASHNVLWERGSFRTRPVEGSVYLTARKAPTAEALYCRSADRGAEMAAQLSVHDRTHRRTVVVSRPSEAQVISVRDDWWWPYETDLEIRWHLGPGVRAELRGCEDDVIGLSSSEGDPLGHLLVEGDGPVSLRSETYSHAGRYGAAEPCVRLVVALGTRSEGHVTTRMVLPRPAPSQ